MAVHIQKFNIYAQSNVFEDDLNEPDKMQFAPCKKSIRIQNSEKCNIEKMRKFMSFEVNQRNYRYSYCEIV